MIKTIQTNCAYCTKLFDAPLRELKRGNGKFCSLKCVGAAKRGPKIIHPTNVSCAYCGIAFYKCKSNQANSKSGLFFCSRQHKDLAQRIGGIKEIMPSHYNTAHGYSMTYRKIAFTNLTNACDLCGWAIIPEILEVHHKDCNRSNNSLDNLAILCPTCHTLTHYQNKTGKFRPSH